jgi:sialate O-acetylesterase
MGRPEIASEDSSIDRAKARKAAVLSLVLGALVRFGYGSRRIEDFWGDSYHHWLISRLTLANHWIPTDYKSLAHVWLPLPHYVVSAAMALMGRGDLVPAHVTNALLGTAACGLAAGLAIEMGADWLIALTAGATVALLPWHVAYCWMHMPEILGGVILLLVLIAALRARPSWLAILGFAGALTRHELTFCMAIVAAWLMLCRQWRAMLALGAGAVAGLAIWSAWSWHVTADPLAWWQDYRGMTRWDGRFAGEFGARREDLVFLATTACRAYPPLPVSLAAIVSAFAIRGRRRLPRGMMLLIALVALQWATLAAGYLAGNLPTLDPRYVLTTAPALAVAGAVAIGCLATPRVRFAVIAMQGVLLLYALGAEFPGFKAAAYVLHPTDAAGRFLSSIAPSKGTFWVDSPAAIYRSGLAPERFVSSEQVNSPRTTDPAALRRAAQRAIASRDIRFILWEHVPYTVTWIAWPEMEKGEAFNDGGYRFEPVYRYDGPELRYGASLSVVWRVERESSVRLPRIFSDHMVLQQNAEASVWGWATPGDEIAVRLGGSTALATTGADGRWRARLSTPPAGGPYDLVVRGRQEVRFTDVLVGEVWLCSGQSNMDMALSRAAAVEVPPSDDPQMRLMKVDYALSEKPRDDVLGSWPWTEATTEKSASFSAVCYYFARHLRRSLEVPVGVISAAYGDSSCEAWMSRESIAAAPRARALAPRSPEVEPEPPRRPSALFNAMIEPLFPYAIRGVAWYQGEGDIAHPDRYRELLPALIRDWRARFEQSEMPFLYVQLAPYRYGVPDLLPRFREAQQAALALPETCMVVTTDLGELDNIHPRKKEQVGNRLARCAMALAYGDRDVAPSGPLYESMDIEGDRVRVRFAHAEHGLATNDARAPSDFTIAGPDGKYLPASTTIEGETVVVWNSQVPQPVAVRFAWDDAAQPNLFNRDGLPASPFRTDAQRLANRNEIDRTD